MEKSVWGETSFSPAFGLTEKETLNSKKLRTEKKNITSRPKQQHEITENYTNYCETWQSYANMQNMIANLG